MIFEVKKGRVRSRWHKTVLVARRTELTKPSFFGAMALRSSRILTLGHDLNTFRQLPVDASFRQVTLRVGLECCASRCAVRQGAEQPDAAIAGKKDPPVDCNMLIEGVLWPTIRLRAIMRVAAYTAIRWWHKSMTPSRRWCKLLVDSIACGFLLYDFCSASEDCMSRICQVTYAKSSDLSLLSTLPALLRMSNVASNT